LILRILLRLVLYSFMYYFSIIQSSIFVHIQRVISQFRVVSFTIFIFDILDTAINIYW